MLTKAESHFLNCLDDSCEVVWCVDRRESQDTISFLKAKVGELEKDVVDLHESGREYFCKNRAAQEKIRELTDKITELSNTLALRDRDIKAMHKAFENISEYQSMLNPNRKNK